MQEFDTRLRETFTIRKDGVAVTLDRQEATAIARQILKTVKA